jgi:ribonuclease-3
MGTTPIAQAETLTARLGYQPRDLGLFVVALTHRSAEGPNNERLEFLGDSVLNLLLSERLYREFPASSEGDLSRLRARLVSEEPLAGIAQDMNLGELLLLGSGELKTGGFRRQSILADAFEALCGALYLDGGLEAVRRTLEPLFETRIAALPEPATLKDPKTRLQEHLQAHGRPLPTYAVTGETGEPHERTFIVTCTIPHAAVKTEGEGPSRRRAEQIAALAALRALGLND